MLTPYQFGSNNPIALIDLDGKEGVVPDFFGDVIKYTSAKLKNLIIDATLNYSGEL